MKTRRGFTLIELIVSMGVTVIILAAIVGFIRGGFISMLSGQSQATAYAKARAVMNDIKDTLKYADPTSIEFTAGSRLYYESAANDAEASVKGSDPSGSDYSYTSREITWDTSTTPPRLKIVKDGDDTKTVYYPDKDDTSNNAFASAEYLKACQAVIPTATGTPFPIFADPDSDNSNGDQKLYDIILPVKYSSMAINTKVDILRTKVNTDQKSFAKAPTGGGKTIPEVLAEVVSNTYNTNQGLLRTGGGTGNFTTNISSAGIHRQKANDGLAGISAQLWKNAFTAEQKAIVGDASWVIVPCDESGNIISTNIKSVAKWKIFVAKNVVDDIPDPNNSYKRLYDCKSSDPQGLNGITEITRLANKEGKYIIRPDYGFITYCYTTDGQTGIIATEEAGYDTAYLRSNLILINYYYWVTANGTDGKNFYKILMNSKSKYIEDYPIGSKGTRHRIDYDGAGAEYTKATAGSSYVYKADDDKQASDTTNW